MFKMHTVNYDLIIILRMIVFFFYRNDFEGAVQEFLISVDDFKSTPLQLELITHLAKRNETNLLDRVLDACKKVHGVVSTSTTLAIAYASANMSVELRRLLTVSQFHILIL